MDLDRGMKSTGRAHIRVNIKGFFFLLLKYFYKIIDHLKQIIIVKFGIFNILRSKMYDNDTTKAKKETMKDYSHKTLIIHGSLQARILKWDAIPFSSGSSQLRDWTQVSRISGRFFTTWATREALQFSSVQSLSCVRLFATPWITACQVFLSITNSWSSLKLLSIESVMPSHPLSSPSPPAPNPSQHQSLFQWVNSLHEVTKVLEF